MTCAYDKMYLPLAQRVLGDMYDFAVNTLHYAIDEFHKMFIASGMATQFEICNPTYVAGKNGCEVAKEVVVECGLSRPEEQDVMYIDKSKEYWTGWALAYYQWESGLNYAEINMCVPISEFYAMYATYHEMDIQILVEYLSERTSKYREESRLRRLRAYAMLSQRQLSNASSVPIRQIQLFEQGERDIRKTQGDTLERLATALHCKIEDLI